MPSGFVSFLAARWKTVLWCAVACLTSLSFLVQQMRKLDEENRRLALQMSSSDAISGSLQRLAILEKENEQLRADLGMIPNLVATRDRLRNELIQQETRKTHAWVGASNVIIAAIAQKSEEISEIYRLSAEEQRRKAREAAEQRLAEKATEESQEPAEDYDLVKQRLQQVCVATKQLLDLRKERAAADKTEENRVAFRSRFQKAAADRMRAMNELGKDHVLYENLPLPPTIEDASKVPVLRSIIPDRRGISTTVYLDGTVVFATAAPSP
jgi:hypothetical protein